MSFTLVARTDPGIPPGGDRTDPGIPPGGDR